MTKCGLLLTGDVTTEIISYHSHIFSWVLKLFQSSDHKPEIFDVFLF